jgi:hypothetical protein
MMRSTAPPPMPSANIRPRYSDGSNALDVRDGIATKLLVHLDRGTALAELGAEE